jgi:antitoxin component YwqK of YwqJK toxin-antitoxin module
MKKYSKSVLFLCIFLSLGYIYAGGMYENVDVESKHLSENTRVTVLDQEIVLKKDTQAMFYNLDGVVSNSLYTGTIAEKAGFIIKDQNFEIPADSKVWFYESGRLKYTIAISKPTAFKIQGKEVLFKELYDLYLPMGFHENGNFYRGILADETSFKVEDRSITIKGMSEFSETGQVLSGILAAEETFIIQGKHLIIPAEQMIIFHENGSVKEWVFFKNDTLFKVQNKKILFASRDRSYQGMSFFENGDVRYGALGKDTIFNVQEQDLTFKELSVVTFYENGSLSSGILLDNTGFSIMDIEVQFRGGSNQSIWFYEDGAIKNGYLAEATELIFKGKPVVIKKNSHVNFDNQGTFISYVEADE